jgi:hypothetical protein
MALYIIRKETPRLFLLGKRNIRLGTVKDLPKAKRRNDAGFMLVGAIVI